MNLIRLDKARESAPVILNLVKDTSWCAAFGVVSIVAIIPVITFQVYEVWKCRKDGWHKISYHLMGLVALSGNCVWMISDLFAHDRYRSYARWIFAFSLIFLGVYAFLSFRYRKQAKTPDRILAISKESNSVIFIHSKLAPMHRQASLDRNHMMMVRHRARR